MSTREYEGLRIATHEDVGSIKKTFDGKGVESHAEREFGRLLLDKTDLIIDYEPTLFYYHDEDEIMRGTVPDYRVINPRTGATTYIEITTASGGKGRQKLLMQQLAPDVHYVVFYRKKLEEIQTKFPEYRFLNGSQSAK